MNRIEKAFEKALDYRFESLLSLVSGPATPADITMANWEEGMIFGFISAATISEKIPPQAASLLNDIAFTWVDNFIRSN